MAVQKDDRATNDPPGVPRKRGRPATGKAKTAAERVRAFRARQRAQEPKRGPSCWGDVEQVTDDICVAVFSYLDGDQVRAKLETFKGIECYGDACRWLRTMRREYLEPCDAGPQQPQAETKYRYEVTPRERNLGGGYNLKMFDGDVEVGGGVFPMEGADDPLKASAWWNGMTDDERAHWLSVTSSGTVVDAWRAYLTSEAEAAALEAGEEWLSSRSVTFD